jgi:hypothetical protein
LNSYGSPWAIRWFFVETPLRSRGPSVGDEIDLSSIQLIENGQHIKVAEDDNVGNTSAVAAAK